MSSVIVAPSYALSAAALVESWRPMIGWENRIGASNVTADSEAALWPVTNLANPSTAEKWLSESTSEQLITVTWSGSDPVDYAGVARHNWGSAGVTVSLEGLVAGGDPEDEDDWSEIVAAHLLADDAPKVYRFAAQVLNGLRFRLVPDGTAPEAAVAHVGKALVLYYGLPPGHVPISQARQTDKGNLRAQSGDYLGTILLSSGLRSAIEQRDLPPDWYRENLEPLRAAAADGATFFFAWAPDWRPDEVGYCWITNDPQPVANQTTGEVDVSLEIAGVIT